MGHSFHPTKYELMGSYRDHAYIQLYIIIPASSASGGGGAAGRRAGARRPRTSRAKTSEVLTYFCILEFGYGGGMDGPYQNTKIQKPQKS